MIRYFPARVSYVCIKCGLASTDSLRPCLHCRSCAELMIVTDYSHVTKEEIFFRMCTAPIPWPLEIQFIAEPWHYLSLDQLRLVHEARKQKGAVTYVLGK